MQTTVEKSIDLDVPVTTAYNQWTQFESFPQFIEAVTDDRQIGDGLTEWTTENQRRDAHILGENHRTGAGSADRMDHGRRPETRWSGDVSRTR